MPYINFSEDDLYRANNADLVSYLGGCGGCVKRVGSTYQYVYTDGSGTHECVPYTRAERTQNIRKAICDG